MSERDLADATEAPRELSLRERLQVDSLRGYNATGVHWLSGSKCHTDLLGCFKSFCGSIGWTIGHLQIFADSHRGFGPIVSLSVNRDARSLQIVSTGWHCTRLPKPVQRQETNFKTSKTLENHSWVLLVLVSPCNKITECVRMHYALI